MRKILLRLPFLARSAAALVSSRVRGGEGYGASTGGDFGGGIWVKSGNIMPLSHGFLVVVVSVPLFFTGSSSWIWVKINLGVEISFSAVLNSSFICKISPMIVS